jgi:serine/threonine protein kinase
MASLPLRATHVLTSVTRRQYRLIEQAAQAPHIWFAQSLRQAYLEQSAACTADILSSDQSKVVIKSPLRVEPAEQWYACQTLNQEIDLLSSRFQGAPGILQLLDRITLVDGPERIDAAVLEHGIMSLHDLQFSVKRPLSRNQVKALTRQLLKALQFIHAEGIVHTGKLASIDRWIQKY